MYLASLAAQFLSVDELDVFSVYEVRRIYLSMVISLQTCVYGVYYSYSLLTLDTHFFFN